MPGGEAKTAFSLREAGYEKSGDRFFIRGNIGQEK